MSLKHLEQRLKRELKSMVIPVLIFIPGFALSLALEYAWHNSGFCQYRSYSGLTAGITFFSMGMVLFVGQVFRNRKRKKRIPISLNATLNGVLFIIGGIVFIISSIGKIITGC